MESRISIAVQKSGRLSEKSLDLIRNCGIDFYADSRVLKASANGFPLDFLFVRDDDIPQYVADGVADIGIVGRNEYDETGLSLCVVRDLKFASCRLSVAVPHGFDYQGLKSLEGKRIATSYPRILSKILKENGVSATPVVVSGSVEVTVDVGVADAIADLVSTGTTLKMNGLEEAECIYKSSAIMIARPDISDDKKAVLESLLERIDAVMMARHKKYILFNLPADKTEEAAAVIGGMKSPTVTPLMDAGWVSVQSAVDEDRFWAVFEKLKKLGAEGILVMNIEKMTE
ncbi:MAG: ATP phosphoribosyltransferase [Spirochaetes bacterium]|uniref:ATP phosphoribosyltransferase n=1 Tax=Candidatus Ornithospirochaeta stercoripullorum TaxID=2840899 RepID=A0A9D9E228_9SPIO|nr:ATP phosphoribosyltransferase [Candidatus Ornithospirochaeta stercoripullorum]